VAVLKKTPYLSFRVFVWKRHNLNKNWSTGCKTFRRESWKAWRFWKKNTSRTWL